LLIQHGPTAAAAEEEEGAEAVTVAEEVMAEEVMAEEVMAEAEATAGAEWVTELVLVLATATLTTRFQPIVFAPQLPDVRGRVTMGMPFRRAAAQAI
jgi:hypothetical protein